MIGTITPLVQGASSSKRWFWAFTSYTFGSTAASAFTGVLLGGLGSLVGGPWSQGTIGLACAAVVFGLIEVAAVPRPPRLIQRSTPRAWRQRFGPTGSALLWGADLGLAVTTRVTFSSTWFLLASVFTLASPLSGLALMCAYGAGRALLVASGPLILRDPDHVAVLDGLLIGVRAWHRLHAYALVVIAVLMTWMSVT